MRSGPMVTPLSAAKNSARASMTSTVTPSGELEELDGLVEPEQLYKVRSRTEHHIYENDRTHRLMERLSRARRTGPGGTRPPF